MKKLLLALATIVGAAAALGASTMSAYADPASDIVGQRSPTHRVYVAKNAPVTINADAANGSQVPVVAASVPGSTGDSSALAKMIGPHVFRNTHGIVIVISGAEAGFDTNYTGTVESEINNIGNAAVNGHPLSTGDNAAVTRVATVATDSR